MFLIDAFKRLPLSIQITWILAVAFVLLLIIPTAMNADFSDSDGSSVSGKRLDNDGKIVERRKRRSRYGRDRDDLSDDRNYYRDDSGDPLDDESSDNFDRGSRDGDVDDTKDDPSREFDDD